MIAAVTSPDVVVELRPPLVAVVLYAASLVVAAVMGVLVVRQIADGSAFSSVFLLFLAGIVAVNSATVLSRVSARTDGWLVIRNRFSTQRVERSAVDRVIEGRQAGFGSTRRLELLLTSGETVRLVATEVPPLPGLRDRLGRQGDQLRDWVAGTTTAPHRL